MKPYWVHVCHILTNLVDYPSIAGHIWPYIICYATTICTCPKDLVNFCGISETRLKCKGGSGSETYLCSLLIACSMRQACAAFPTSAFDIPGISYLILRPAARGALQNLKIVCGMSAVALVLAAIQNAVTNLRMFPTCGNVECYTGKIQTSNQSRSRKSPIQ